MSRYIQAGAEPAKPVKGAKKEKPRELPKQGAYTIEALSDGVRKINSGTGGTY